MRSGVLFLVCLSVACAADPAPEAASDEIINGNLDLRHSAVVALVGDQLCSGTIVAKDVERGIGWVVTAAHCLEADKPKLAIAGADYAAKDAVHYKVVDFKPHPAFEQKANINDFGIVTIAGVDDATPVIPLAVSPDEVAEGVEVTSVGYGRNTVEREGKPTTQRHSIRQSVKTVTSEFVGFDLAQSGHCNGDSGGPVLIDSGKGERVVAVHSYVMGGCDGEGFSARITGGGRFFEDAMVPPSAPMMASAEDDSEEPVTLSPKSKKSTSTTTTTSTVGCSSARSSGGAGWGLLFVLALFCRRRR